MYYHTRFGNASKTKRINASIPLFLFLIFSPPPPFSLLLFLLFRGTTIRSLFTDIKRILRRVIHELFRTLSDLRFPFSARALLYPCEDGYKKHCSALSWNSASNSKPDLRFARFATNPSYSRRERTSLDCARARSLSYL